MPDDGHLRPDLDGLYSPDNVCEGNVPIEPAARGRAAA